MTSNAFPVAGHPTLWLPVWGGSDAPPPPLGAAPLPIAGTSPLLPVNAPPIELLVVEFDAAVGLVSQGFAPPLSAPQPTMTVITSSAYRERVIGLLLSR